MENLDKILADLNDTKVSTLETFKVKTDEIETKSEDEIPMEITHTIIQTFANYNKTTQKNALIGIVFLVQEGGTNSSKKNLIRTVNDVRFDINDLRTIIKNNYKNGTVRQLAKTLRTEISKIALINGWKGTLYRDLSKMSKEVITSEQAVYCCEIYSDCYDPYMPPVIRELLQQREKEIMDSQKRKIKNPPKKGGKKKKK